MSYIPRWDTAGQEDYKEARTMCYSGTDVLLIGFSIGEPDSLANVEDLWLGESKLESLKDAKVNAFHTFYPCLRFFRNCWWA